MKQPAPHSRASERRQHSAPHSRTQHLHPRRAVLAGLVVTVVVAATVGGGALLWLNRTVGVLVNGTPVQVRASSTLAEIAEAEKVEVKPGNLVSVGG